MLKSIYAGDHPNEKLARAKRNHKKELFLLELMEKTMPSEFNITYSMSCDLTCINLHIHREHYSNFSAEETRALLLWTSVNCGKPKIKLTDKGKVYYVAHGKMRFDKDTEWAFTVFVNE